MSAAGIVETVLRLALLLAGLLLPGTMLLRALRLPWSPAAAFAGSALLLYALVAGLGGGGVAINLSSLAAGLAVAALLGRLLPARGTVAALSPWHACFTRLGGWTPLYVLFWLVVGWRLATQPLAGPDVGFRWSWLAEQILRFGTLDFYPARSGADFLKYFWAESIPPGVASLYVWAYACGASTSALWTSPVIALQLLALHELVWRLGNRWGGEVVARRAVVLAAATPLLTWAVLIGQETGLTALAVGGMAWALAHVRDEDGDRWAVLAGIFAGLGSVAREYGPVFAVAAVALAALGGSRRRAALVAAVALPLAAAWPLRTWLLTGNPFHSLDVLGLFPVNTEFAAWSAAFHAPHANPLGTPAGWLGLLRYLALWALPALLGLGVLAVLLLRGLRDSRLPALLVALTLALWLASLPYTAGGLFYSLRVLSPALVLLPVLAAYGSNTWVAPIVAHVVSAAFAIMLAESLPKTLVLPENPYRVPVAGWSRSGANFADSVRANEQALLDTFKRLPASPRIIADNAGLPRLFAPLGVEVMPLWSPDIAWLFDPALPAEEVARRWAQAELRYLVLGQTPSGAAHVLSRARWHAPYFSVRPIAESGGNVILEAVVQPH